jgi:hypothetical protein
MSIPFVVRLWEDVNFKGTRRNIVTTENDLNRQLFNDKTSSIEVCDVPNVPGSSWVKVYQHAGFQGRYLPLKDFCKYKNIHGVLGFGDIVSSLDLNPNINPGDRIISDGIRYTGSRDMQVFLILQVFDKPNCSSDAHYAYVVENITKMTDYFGNEFDDKIQSIYCDFGPSHPNTNLHRYKAVVYEHNDYSGASMEITPWGGDGYGYYNNLGNLKNKISSIKIVEY